MKKIFSVLVAVVSAVTLMAQELPTVCDAQIDFRYCFTTTATLTRPCYESELPIEWNGVTFTALNDPKTTTIMNVRGCDSVITMTVVEKEPPVGCAGGKNARGFSVSADQEVFFSQGNLQYCNSPLTDPKSRVVADASKSPKAGIFRFAENQYDYVGCTGWDYNNYLPGNVYYDNNGVQTKCRNLPGNEKAADYHGWTDLFAWATSGILDPLVMNSNPSIFKVNNDPYADIEGTNYDWGVYNAISNGGDEPGLWRTLTKDEWNYLFNSRANAAQKWARATVNGAKGVVLLPDKFTWPESLQFTATPGTNFTANTFDLTAWTSMEAAGAVFLPCGGFCIRGSGSNPGQVSEWDLWNYWSSTASQNEGCDEWEEYCQLWASPDYAYKMALDYFDEYKGEYITGCTYYGYRPQMISVRLVQDK